MSFSRPWIVNESLVMQRFEQVSVSSLLPSSHSSSPVMIWSPHRGMQMSGVLIVPFSQSQVGIDSSHVGRQP